MKCICMILTSNRSESCNRNVLSKNMVFQGRKGKVQNFGMASAFPLIEEYSFNITIKADI